ncbi:MAG: hypothetical protein Q9200_004910 [Gallowayella weberi]
MAAAAANVPGASSKPTSYLHLQTPPTPHSAPPRIDEEAYEELEVTLNETIRGHYRHGKTGYRRVGVLFLSWEEDDMQCKETEVDALRKLFEEEFNYETDYFLIPKDRWQTALQKRIADLLYEYDSPDCLTIVYYGGHGYVGVETQSLKLAAHVGKRKFEMIVSSGCKGEAARVPAPLHAGSFTKSLDQVLRKLLRENKDGFATSQLYREIYHTIPHKVKPWHFDQARRDYGRIWLRPQLTQATENPRSAKGATYLNLTLELNEKPNSVVMNQLALQLQYLPHVQQVRFEKLYAPKKQIEDFMLRILQAIKLRPLIRKIYARRRLRKLMALPQSERINQRPSSFVSLFLDQKQFSECDWSSALDGHNPTPTSPLTSPSRHLEKRSSTWPPVEAGTTKKGTTFSNRFFSVDYQITLPRASSIPGIFQPRRVKTIGGPPTAPAEAAPMFDFAKYRNMGFAVTSVQSMAGTSPTRGAASRSDALWHLLMWLALCYTLWCFCYYMKE